MDFFTKTQMFDFFIQERVARKEIDWFDKSCLSKLRFEVTNLRNTRFNSHLKLTNFFA
jgi:hypothetical protein